MGNEVAVATLLAAAERVRRRLPLQCLAPKPSLLVVRLCSDGIRWRLEGAAGLPSWCAEQVSYIENSKQKRDRRTSESHSFDLRRFLGSSPPLLSHLSLASLARLARATRLQESLANESRPWLVRVLRTVLSFPRELLKLPSTRRASVGAVDQQRQAGRGFAPTSSSLRASAHHQRESLSLRPAAERLGRARPANEKAAGGS